MLKPMAANGMKSWYVFCQSALGHSFFIAQLTDEEVEDYMNVIRKLQVVHTERKCGTFYTYPEPFDTKEDAIRFVEEELGFKINKEMKM